MTFLPFTSLRPIPSTDTEIMEERRDFHPCRNGMFRPFSYDPQTNLGTGFLNSTMLTQLVVRAINTSNGAMTLLPGIEDGPILRIAVNAAPPLQNLSSLTMTVSKQGNGLIPRAVGLEPLRTNRLPASETLNGASDSAEGTGAQLQVGVPITSSSTKQFVRCKFL